MVFAKYEYYWHEANCNRKIAALCEIDLNEVGCNAFGKEDITSPKWGVGRVENFAGSHSDKSYTFEEKIIKNASFFHHDKMFF